MSNLEFPDIPEPINKTQDLPFVWGSFGLNSWTIPYFSMTMEIKEAAKFLRLASELPNEKSRDFNIEELFQRNIDWGRVEKSITPWLQDSRNPQFFSALTVVLIPYSKESKSLVYSEIQQNQWDPPSLEANLTGKKIQSGPINIEFFRDFQEFGTQNSLQGRLAWNLDQAFAIAIDGQHRLAAIKSVVKRDEYQDFKKMRIPVNVIIFDEKIGFKKPDNEEFNALKLMRKIFIDVNKHAKEVKRARQLLLDDVTPQALALRSLMQDALSNSLDTNPDVDEKLALSIVDWHKDDAKFEGGPYLTSVLSLDEHVSTLIGANQPAKPTDHDKYEKYISALSENIDVDLSKSKEILKYVRPDFRPFSFALEDLQQIKSNFPAIWLPTVREIFFNLNPYKELLQTRKAKNTFTLDWQTWFKLKYDKFVSNDAEHTTAEYVNFRNLLQDRDADKLYESDLISDLSEIESQKKDFQVAFAVVFQKTLFKVIATLTRGSIAKDVLTFLEESLESVDLKESTVAYDDSENEDIEENLDLGEELDSSSAPLIENVVSDDLDNKVALPPSENAIKLGVQYHAVTSDFVSALNELTDNWPDFYKFSTQGKNPDPDLTFRWWDGTLLFGGRVNHAGQASDRARDLLVATYILRVIKDNFTYSSFEDFMEDIETDIANEESLVRQFKRLYDRMCGKNGLGRMIVTGKNLPWADNKDLAKSEVRKRMSIVWETFN